MRKQPALLDRRWNTECAQGQLARLDGAPFPTPSSGAKHSRTENTVTDRRAWDRKGNMGKYGALPRGVWVHPSAEREQQRRHASYAAEVSRQPNFNLRMSLGPDLA